MKAQQITDTISVPNEFFMMNATASDIQDHAKKVVANHVKQEGDRLELLAEAAKLELLAKLIKEQASLSAREDIEHYGSEGADKMGVLMTIEQGQTKLKIQ